MRTISQPADASRSAWSAVAVTSCVSVVVIDWTRIGFAPPTPISPTRTSNVGTPQVVVGIRNVPPRQAVDSSDERAEAFDRRIELLRVIATGLREVRPTAALPTDHPRHLADQVAGP